MKLKLFAVILAAALWPVLSQAQGVRFSPASITTTATVAGVSNVYIAVTNSTIAFCNAPANSVPCTNKATTYTSVTLATPCALSTQVVLDNTNTCVGAPDALGNWGVWAPAGAYQYTITIASGASFGPFDLTLGAGPVVTTGSGNPVGPCTASRLYVDTTTGNVWSCNGGVWVSVGTVQVNSVLVPGPNFVSQATPNGITFAAGGGTIVGAISNIAGGGNAAVLCTITTPTQKDFLAFDGSSICKNFTPGVAFTDKFTSNTPSYSWASLDRGNAIIQQNAGGAMTGTSPDLTTAGFGGSWYTRIFNVDTAGTLTISKSGSSTINLQNSLAITPNTWCDFLGNATLFKAACANWVKSDGVTIGSTYNPDGSTTFGLPGGFPAVTTNPYNLFYEYDNFCAYDGATRFGTHLWTVGGTGGTVANGQATTTTNYPCAATVASGATSGNWGSFGPFATSAVTSISSLIGSDHYFVFEFEQHSGAPQQASHIGWMGTNVTGDPANFIGLRSVETAAGANWFFVCRSAAVDGTATDTTIPVDTAKHKFKLHFTSATSYIMTLDSGTPTTVNTGCPSSFLAYPAFKVDTSENVTKKLSAFYWQWTNPVTR